MDGAASRGPFFSAARGMLPRPAALPSIISRSKRVIQGPTECASYPSCFNVANTSAVVRQRPDLASSTALTTGDFFGVGEVEDMSIPVGVPLPLTTTLGLALSSDCRGGQHPARKVPAALVGFGMVSQ